MTNDLFEDYTRYGPEPKLELIDGRLIVGNNLAASRLLLRHILTGWGASAAVALAPIEQWLEALSIGFGAPVPRELSSAGERLAFLKSWASAVAFQAEDLIAGFGGEGISHNLIHVHITSSLWRVSHVLGGGCHSRDFVMGFDYNCFTL